MNKKLFRIAQLETKAKNIYIDFIEWEEVINMLSDDEQEEYYELMRAL